MTSEVLPVCQDCGARPGEAHGGGCDTAVCVHTGQQRIQCGIGVPEFTGPVLTGWRDYDPHPGEDCGQDIWTGHWPGELDAIRLGWWCYFAPGQDPSWVRCGPDHPQALPDLNRLAIDGKWDKDLRRWETRVGHEIVTWDHREQPEIASFVAALSRVSQCTVFAREADTGAGQYAWVITDREITDREATALYEQWLEER